MRFSITSTTFPWILPRTSTVLASNSRANAVFATSGTIWTYIVATLGATEHPRPYIVDVEGLRIEVSDQCMCSFDMCEGRALEVAESFVM